MSNIELSPCPFCGSKAVFSTVSAETAAMNLRLGFSIKCSKCGVTMPGKNVVEMTLSQDGSLNIYKDEREAAAEIWNGRTKA
ncbi:MAG: Lar family restriction alleviation protein [Oscillospiraceae bacterium]|nr:Lar family restriction alleviation protein [Oscillospiraceae bacterium]